MRIRLKYSKDETLAYISHRDLLSFLMRVLRKASVPVAMSRGFTPKPRVTFGPALSLGVKASNEPVDVELNVEHLAAPRKLLMRLISAGRPLRFIHDLETLEPDAPKVSKLACYARYLISVSSSTTTLSSAVEAYARCIAAKGLAPDQMEIPIPEAVNDNVLMLDIPLAGDYAINILSYTRQLAQVSRSDCSSVKRNCLLDTTRQPI
jgi:hypothetical protein